MTLPNSGPLSLDQIRAEFGGANPVPLSSYYRGGPYVSANGSGTQSIPTSGPLSVANFYGASNRSVVSSYIGGHQANFGINVSTLPNYVPGKSDITITVGGGIYIYSTDVNTPAFSIYGATGGDTILLVNNGFIMGMGGTSAGQATVLTSGQSGTMYPAQSGGSALSIGYPVTVNNTNGSAYIGGGGGGGGSISNAGLELAVQTGGGGAGGGPAGNGYGGGLNDYRVLPGPAGGGIGGGGASGVYDIYITMCAGGGGRVFPGNGGASVQAASRSNYPGNGGTCGGGGPVSTGKGITGYSAAGGSSNGAGGTGYGFSGSGYTSAGGGGGWGASGGAATYTASTLTAFSPGGGGRSVQLNGHSVTWVNGDTSRVWGGVS